MTNRDKLTLARHLIDEVQSGLNTATHTCGSCGMKARVDAPEAFSAETLGGMVTKLGNLLANPTQAAWLAKIT